MTPNRTHLAGLELALESIDVSGCDYMRLKDLIEQAQSAPEPVQGEAVEVVCIKQGGCNVTWTATKELTPAGTALMSVRPHERIMAAATHPADQVADPLKQTAWKRLDGVMGCSRFMTQKRYDAQSPQMKGNYEPFYCAHCVAGQVADAERWRFYAPEVARRVGVTLEKMNAVIDESRLANSEVVKT